VVIADLMLGDSSPEQGLALVRLVKANHGGAKTIVITGCGEGDIEDRSRDAGAGLFFAKPVPGARLRKALETFRAEQSRS